MDVLTGIPGSELKDGVGRVSINCSANADTKRGCGGIKSLCYGTVVVTHGPFLQHDSLFIPLKSQIPKSSTNIFMILLPGTRKTPSEKLSLRAATNWSYTLKSYLVARGF